MGEGPPGPGEFAQRAEEHLHEGSLTPAEYEAIKQSVGELSPIFTAECSYFVLGSYGRPEIHRLQLVKDRLNRRTGAYAFLMVDIRSEWENTYLKFRLIADYVDRIVGVSEHAHGGFLVEQGYFTAIESYFSKTYVLKREYKNLDPDDLETNVETSDPYSGMQTSIFEMLADAGRLCVWEQESDLRECVESLF